jgi:hypothetical protein
LKEKRSNDFMLIRLKCINCGQGLRVSKEVVGSTIKCPKCKTPFTAMHSAEDEPETADPPTRPASDVEVALARGTQEFGEKRKTSEEIQGSEPWYYTFLFQFTRILLILEVLAASLAVLVWVGWLLILLVTDKKGGAALAFCLVSLPFFLWLLFAFCISVYTLCFTFVFLDAARNVRKLLLQK